MRIHVTGSSFTVLKDEPFNVELEIDGVLLDDVKIVGGKSIYDKGYDDGYQTDFSDGYEEGSFDTREDY